MNLFFKVFLGIAIAAALPAVTGDHVVMQQDRAFSLAELSIRLGDSITFKNADKVAHNVFSVSTGLEFDIRRQAPGGSSTITFSKKGVAQVRCSIHPKMKLLVTVTE